MDVLGVELRFRNCEGGNGALHPDGHSFESYQLPVVESFQPSDKLAVDVYHWGLDRVGGLNRHAESVPEEGDQGHRQLLMLLLEAVVLEEEGVGFYVLVNGVSEVFGQVALDVGVDCRPREGQHGHFPSLEVLVLPVELVGDHEGEGVRGEGEGVPVGCFHCLAVEQQQVPD